MITLQNMIFANPQAYRVFPQIGNPYNTGITDTAIYEGYLQVTDSNGTTKSFSNTNIVDFTGFTGIIDIDQYTSIGSVKLGRWDTDKIGITQAVWTLDQISHATIIDAIPAEGYDSGVNSTDINFSIEYTSDTIEGVSIIPVENMEDFSGDYDWFTISNLGDRGMGRAAFYFDLVVQPNTNTESRSVQVPISWEWHRTEDTPDNVFEGMNHIVGTSYLTITQLGVQEPVYKAPYTPGWSMEFGYIPSGTAAKKITNGIEVYSTGPDTSSDTATFFNYNEAIKEGETYYQATIQVTGMKEGYTIVGVRGWEYVTITQDGEYILPAYTWTNEQGLPEGSDIYNDYKPALKFAVGTESNVVWDEPITLVITAVETI